ncbi:hypothetical protein MN608_11278 [Microdochium nivale]|nr:hypothetical protein MN608_11278 [Microdochium nivale]
MADNDENGKPALSALPREVFDNIVSRLEGKDLKNLRLAHPGHDGFILRYLFRRVCLSMLKKDRAAFLAIAELICQWALDNGYEGYEYGIRDVVKELMEVSWLPIGKDHSPAFAVWDAFRPIFDAALDNMPHLATLVMEPASSRAQRKRLPIIDDILTVEDTEDIHILGEPNGPYRIAREFLQQAIECSIDRVDLSLGHVDTIWIESAVDQLLSARALQELHVSSNFQDSLGPRDREDEQMEIGTMFLVYLQGLKRGWDNLRDFSMKCLRVPVQPFAQFIEFHAATLQKLSFMHCALTVAHVEALAGISLPLIHTLEAFTEGSTITKDPARFMRVLRHGSSHCGSHILDIPAHQTDTGVNIWDETHEINGQYPDTITLWAIPKGRRYLVEVKQYFTSFQFSKERYKFRWKWGRAYPGAEVFYWRADDDDDSEPTVMWRRTDYFEYTYFQNAHEAFKDWSPGWGNVAEPTPFGPDFKRFVDDQPASLGHAAFSRGIPAEAKRFDADEITREVLVNSKAWLPRYVDTQYSYPPQAW